MFKLPIFDITQYFAVSVFGIRSVNHIRMITADLFYGVKGNLYFSHHFGKEKKCFQDDIELPKLANSCKN